MFPSRVSIKLYCYRMAVVVSCFETDLSIFSVRNMYRKVPNKWYQRVLTLSLPRVINFKFPLQPHQKYYITQ